MTEVNLPIFTGVYKNIDESASNDSSFSLINGFIEEVDGKAILNSRPGFDEENFLPSLKPIDGAIYIDVLKKIFVVSNGDLWKVDPVTFVGENLSASSTVKVPVGVRPSFAFDGTNLYFAAKSPIAYSDGTIPTQIISDPDAPTMVTHLMLLDTYLIANDVGTGKFKFSEVDNPTVWSALDFASAGSEPDDINALYKFRGEVYLHGRETTEIWENDGETPFARVNGGTLDVGCIAPYSITKFKNYVMWLSNERRFVSFSGKNIEEISTKYDREIAKFKVVSDCVSDKYFVLGKVFVLFQFPSEQRTIVYNQTDDTWAEWGMWDEDGGHYLPFVGKCATYLPESGKMFIGSGLFDGKLYTMSDDSITDNNTSIRLETRSGHISFGTNNKKQNIEMSFRAKRGRVTDSSEPVVSIRFKDNDKEWGHYIPISLGKLGDTFNIIKKYKLGYYNTRQYELVVKDPIGVVFSEAKEKIEVTKQ